MATDYRLENDPESGSTVNDNDKYNTDNWSCEMQNFYTMAHFYFWTVTAFIILHQTEYSLKPKSFFYSAPSSKTLTPTHKRATMQTAEFSKKINRQKSR